MRVLLLRLFRSLRWERRPGQVAFFRLIDQAHRFVVLGPRYDPVIKGNSRMPTHRFPYFGKITTFVATLHPDSQRFEPEHSEQLSMRERGRVGRVR